MFFNMVLPPQVQGIEHDWAISQTCLSWKATHRKEVLAVLPPSLPASNISHYVIDGLFADWQSIMPQCMSIHSADRPNDCWLRKRLMSKHNSIPELPSHKTKELNFMLQFLETCLVISPLKRPEAAPIKWAERKSRTTDDTLRSG